MFELFPTTDLSQSQLSHQYKEKRATFLHRMLATGEWREFKLNLLTPLHKAGLAETVGQNTRLPGSGKVFFTQEYTRQKFRF